MFRFKKTTAPRASSLSAYHTRRFQRLFGRTPPAQDDGMGLA